MSSTKYEKLKTYYIYPVLPPLCGRSHRQKGILPAMTDMV